MKPHEIQVKVNIAQREADYWRQILRDKACKNCVEWEGNTCRLAGHITPPPDVQKTGCPEWTYDQIPF